MRRKWWWVMVMAGLACTAPARAETPPDRFARLDAQIEALLAPRALLGSVVTERDLDLLLAHVKAALLAAAAGAEPPSTDALNRRAEAIGNVLRARGTLAALLLLEALEASARERLRELPARPRTPDQFQNP